MQYVISQASQALTPQHDRDDGVMSFVQPVLIGNQTDHFSLSH
ncbi:hypothetical protein PALA55_02299 [Pseudomonas aeruginosa]|nr:hypothetical protein PALA55_02299 [Pseudomonas aeruginosa]